MIAEGTGMAGKRSTPEQIVAKLRQVEVLTAQGKPVAEAVRAIGISGPSYYRWRAEYGGLKLKPAAAAVWAMPLPLSPQPRTPTVEIP